MGFLPDDERLKQSFEIAKEQGVKVQVYFSKEETSHPNTARIVVEDDRGNRKELVGVSMVGGNIEIWEINGMPVSFQWDYPTLLVFHRDRPGL